MNIITVSREFGSGGRELAKRMSDKLGFEYYDREIISFIAEDQGLDEHYVEKTLEYGYSQQVPLSFGRTLSWSGSTMSTKVLIGQKRVISRIAEAGRDFIIVGRSADVLLAEYAPFNIFVFADMLSKIDRCRSRVKPGETLTDRELEQNIRRIDSSRAKAREIISGGKWGQKECYHLCVNTSGWNIAALASSVAEVADCWFAQKKK